MSVTPEPGGPGGCRHCCRPPGVSIATQTLVTWVQEGMGMLEESIQQVDSHVESMTVIVGEVGDIIKEIMDETISEASSLSRQASFDSPEEGGEMEDLVLALSDSECSIPSVKMEEGDKTSSDLENANKKSRSSRRGQQSMDMDRQVVEKEKVNKDTEGATESQEAYTIKKDEGLSCAFYSDPASLCVRYRCTSCPATLPGSGDTAGHQARHQEGAALCRQELRVGVERIPVLKESADSEQETDEVAWVAGDATLPEGWQFTDPYILGGRQVRRFRTPCGAELNSREEAADWLQARGVVLVVPTGLPVPVTDESTCTGHCEGGCPLLAIHPSLFRDDDYNRTRKKANITYAEPEANIRNRLVKSAPTSLAGPGLCYGGAVFKADKPRILCIQEEDCGQSVAQPAVTQSPVREETSLGTTADKKDTPRQKRNEINEQLTMDVTENKEEVKIVDTNKAVKENMMVEQTIQNEVVEVKHRRESKNGGKGKKSSNNKIKEEHVMEENKEKEGRPRSLRMSLDGKPAEKETKNGGKGKKSSANSQQGMPAGMKETNNCNAQINDQLSVDMSPTKADKKKLKDALKKQPQVFSSGQNKVSPKQQVAALANIIQNSKRRSRSIAETSLLKGHQVVEGEAKLRLQSRESIDSSPMVSSESEMEMLPMTDTETDSAVSLSSQSSRTDTEGAGADQTKGRKEKTNGPIALSSDTEASETEGRKARPAKRGQGKPMNLAAPVTTTPKSKPPHVIEEDTPKRSKRKLDSMNDECERSSKRVITENEKASPRIAASTPKTPKNSENKLGSLKKSVKTPKTPSTPVLTSKDEESNMKMNIEKLKLLQKQEITLIEKEGTYVQCSKADCQLWRLVSGYDDPATVPDSWTCHMNSDPEARTCGLGGERVEEEETVDVEYTCGSMVWAKLKGFPAWPGMVDYCPDTQEFYWMEEEVSEAVPAWYHVVFFEGKGNSVTRSWVRTGDLRKMVEPVVAPAGWAKIQGTKKLKMRGTLEMAQEAIVMPRLERLETFSFATLFTGKWGKFADLTIGEEPEDDEDDEKVETPVKKKKIELVKTPKTPKSAPVPLSKKVKSETGKPITESLDFSRTRKNTYETINGTPKSSLPKSHDSAKNKIMAEHSETINDTPKSSKNKRQHSEEINNTPKSYLPKSHNSSKNKIMAEHSETINDTPKSTLTKSEENAKNKIMPQHSETITDTPTSSLPKSHDSAKSKIMARKAAIMNLDSPRRDVVSRKSVSKPTLITPSSQTDIRDFVKGKSEKVEHSGEDEVKKHETIVPIEATTPQRNTPVDRVVNSEPMKNTAGPKVAADEENVGEKMGTILSPLAAPTSPIKVSLKMPEKRSLVRLPSTDFPKKTYSKPPLPSDVLIALAVRNLDPENHYGAKFSSIQAFLSLHFPYFNDQKLECREMIRRAYDINSKEETGKENFRIKGSLVEQLSVRIKSYVDRSRSQVREAMLVPDLLEVLLDKFEHGGARGAEGRVQPPWSTKMLAYLALLTLRPPASSEQVLIFLSLVFPALEVRNESKRQEYERVLRTDENIVDGNRKAILDTVHRFFSSNSNRKALRESIYKLEFVKLVLPDVD